MDEAARNRLLHIEGHIATIEMVLGLFIADDPRTKTALRLLQTTGKLRALMLQTGQPEGAIPGAEEALQAMLGSAPES